MKIIIVVAGVGKNRFRRKKMSIFKIPTVPATKPLHYHCEY